MYITLSHTEAAQQCCAVDHNKSILMMVVVTSEVDISIKH